MGALKNVVFYQVVVPRAKKRCGRHWSRPLANTKKQQKNKRIPKILTKCLIVFQMYLSDLHQLVHAHVSPQRTSFAEAWRISKGKIENCYYLETAALPSVSGFRLRLGKSSMRLILFTFDHCQTKQHIWGPVGVLAIFIVSLKPNHVKLVQIRGTHGIQEFNSVSICFEPSDIVCVITG